MMHHTTKRGFKDCPGFLNSTGRLGPKRGRKCYVTPAFSGVPDKGNKIKTQNLRRGSPSCTTQQSVDSKIVPVSSIAPDGWGPMIFGNVALVLPSSMHRSSGAGLGELATQPQQTLPQGRGIYTIYIPKWTRI